VTYHGRDRRALDRTVAELRDLHGDRLRSVVLVGEAATDDYRARKSPLSLVVVVDEITPDTLRAMRSHVRRWWRRRVPTPLLLDMLYIESSLDVFALEFLDMCDRHRVLHGEDPFAGLRIDPLHLRMEVEEQMRGKMLHLWEACIGAGRSRRVLRRVLLDTPPDFEVVLRAMLKLHHEERPHDAETLIAAIEARFDVGLPTFHRLEAVRAGRERLARGDLDAAFDAYLAEVRSLVRVVDEL